MPGLRTRKSLATKQQARDKVTGRRVHMSVCCCRSRCTHSSAICLTQSLTMKLLGILLVLLSFVAVALMDQSADESEDPRPPRLLEYVDAVPDSHVGFNHPRVHMRECRHLFNNNSYEGPECTRYSYCIQENKTTEPHCACPKMNCRMPFDPICLSAPSKSGDGEIEFYTFVNYCELTRKCCKDPRLASGVFHSGTCMDRGRHSAKLPRKINRDAFTTSLECRHSNGQPCSKHLSTITSPATHQQWASRRNFIVENGTFWFDYFQMFPELKTFVAELGSFDLGKNIAKLGVFSIFSGSFTISSDQKGEFTVENGIYAIKTKQYTWQRGIFTIEKGRFDFKARTFSVQRGYFADTPKDVTISREAEILAR